MSYVFVQQIMSYLLNDPAQVGALYVYENYFEQC